MSKTPRGYGPYHCHTCSHNGTGRHILCRSEGGGVVAMCDGACEDD